MPQTTPSAAALGPPAGEASLRAIAMPADTNPNGDIFGGWLLSQMDLAGGNFAGQRSRGRVATVAVTAMTFHLPVFVGDEVSCFCALERVGRTSMTVRVETCSPLTGVTYGEAARRTPLRGSTSRRWEK